MTSGGKSFNDFSRICTNPKKNHNRNRGRGLLHEWAYCSSINSTRLNPALAPAEHVVLWTEVITDHDAV